METLLDIPEILEAIETADQIRLDIGSYDEVIKVLNPQQLKAVCPSQFRPGQRELVAALLSIPKS